MLRTRGRCAISSFGKRRCSRLRAGWRPRRRVRRRAPKLFTTASDGGLTVSTTGPVVDIARQPQAAAQALDHQFVARFAGGEIPARGADQSVGGAKAERHRILGFVSRQHVAGAGAHQFERPEPVVEQVEHVAGEVMEVPAAALRRQAPGRLARDLRQPVVHAHQRTEASRTQDLLDGRGAREVTPVIGDVERRARRREGLHHLLELPIGAPGRLFHQAGLARARDGQRVAELVLRRRRDVDGVHLGMRDHFGRVRGGDRRLQPLRRLAKLRRVAPHDRHQAASGRGAERRAGLAQHDIAAADDSPADRRFHRWMIISAISAYQRYAPRVAENVRQASGCSRPARSPSLSQESSGCPERQRTPAA